MNNPLRTIAERLHRPDDERARRRGWEITTSRSGLGRTYRDPRFNELASCPDCDGTGEAGDQPCEHCAGSGRIRRRPELPANAGEPRRLS